jgi:uncharacterized protein (DUF58 family)
VSPSRRVAFILAGLAALAPFVDGGLLVLAALVLAGLTIGDALSVRRAPEVERSVPVTLSRGVGAPLVVRVAGDRHVTVRQPVPPGFTITPDRDAGTLDAVIVGRVRGRHALPAVATRSVGPLGLGRWDHVVGEPLDVAVYPDLPAARGVVNAVRHGLARDLAQLTRGALGLGTELERVRDYVPDDEVRQVNWKATARMGKPMSNEYRLDEDRDVVCVVDIGRLMAAPTGADRTRLDVACDAIASVALVADDVGDRIGTIAFDREIRRLVKPRRRGGRAVIDALFDVEPSPTDSDHVSAFHGVGGGKRACVIVFTDLVDVAAASSMVDAMPVLARRHAVVVASVTDDDIGEILRKEPETAVDVHAAAIAVDVLRARADAVAALRDAGAVVIEAPAHALGRACVGAYLTLKARARL